MEHQERKLAKERIGLEKVSEKTYDLARKTLMMFKEAALKPLAATEREGSAKTYKCPVCYSAFTICLGGTGCKEPKTCPSCNAPLMHTIVQPF